MKQLLVVINENMLCSLDYAIGHNIQDVIARSLTVLDFKNWSGSQPRGASRPLHDNDTIRFPTEEDTKIFPTYAVAINAMINAPDFIPSTVELCDLSARLRYEMEKAAKDIRECVASNSIDTHRLIALRQTIDNAAADCCRETNKAVALVANLDPDITYSDKAKEALTLIGVSTKEVCLSPLFAKMPKANEVIESMCRADIPDGDDMQEIIGCAIMAYHFARAYHASARDIYQMYIRASATKESLCHLSKRMETLDQNFRLVQRLLVGLGINIDDLDSAHSYNWSRLTFSIKSAEDLIANTAGIVKECRADIDKFNSANPDSPVELPTPLASIILH